jgi:hypothetical protein
MRRSPPRLPLDRRRHTPALALFDPPQYLALTPWRAAWHSTMKALRLIRYSTLAKSAGKLLIYYHDYAVIRGSGG